MGAAENKELLRHIFSELSKGNSKPFVESMAEASERGGYRPGGYAERPRRC